MVQCRSAQEQTLKAFLSGPVSPNAIAVHGTTNTGKTITTKSVLDTLECSYSWVPCDQCTTARVLLQRALRSIFESTKTGNLEEASCENVDIFISLLSQRFTNYDKKHVLVLDRIDQLPDFRSLNELYNGFTRLPELSNNLSNFVVVFIYSTIDPRVLVSNPHVPRVWFPRYTYEEVSEIIDLELEFHELGPVFRKDYLELVVNALKPAVGSDLVALKRAACKIWPMFIEGVVDESVAKVYIQKPQLFKPEFITDKLETTTHASPHSPRSLSTTNSSLIGNYLVCAAYLASYNPPRYDMRYFSLAKSMRNRRRETKPKKSATIPARSLAAPTFEMERMLAIFHAIFPNPFEFQSSVSVTRQLATLTEQNLIMKSQSDILDSRTKWKINVPWSYVQVAASNCGFEIEEYLLED